jgi:hypothetical protein
MPVQDDGFEMKGFSEAEEPEDERKKNLGAGRKDYVGRDPEVVLVKVGGWKRFRRWMHLRAERRRREKLERKREQLAYEERRRKCKWCRGTGTFYNKRLQRDVTCPECIEPRRPPRPLGFNLYD